MSTATTSFRLRGRLFPGMFPTEWAFVVTDWQGEPHTVWVPKDVVDGEANSGTLAVRVLDRANGLSLVWVPGEPLDSSNAVSVRDADLLSA